MGKAGKLQDGTVRYRIVNFGHGVRTIRVNRLLSVGKQAAWGAAVFFCVLFANPSQALTQHDLALITQSAEQGDSSSQLLLAIAYLNGDSQLAKAPDKATYWFEQAAILGNAYAEERLGDAYEQGVGVPVNEKLAFDWRMKAARRGIVLAQLKIGKMYQDGIGVDRDREQAWYWFRRAANEGNTEAQQLLARFHHYAGDVEVDRAVARSWFEKVAKQGYEGAILFLSVFDNIRYQADEVWHNRLPELHKVAEDGDLEAAYQLGLRYERGVGCVAKDAAAAVDWYRRAAAGEHRQAVLALARIYASGLGGVAPKADATVKWAARAKSSTP